MIDAVQYTSNGRSYICARYWLNIQMGSKLQYFHNQLLSTLHFPVSLESYTIISTTILRV